MYFGAINKYAYHTLEPAKNHIGPIGPSHLTSSHLKGMLSSLEVAGVSIPPRPVEGTEKIDNITGKSYTALAVNSCSFYCNHVAAIVGTLVEEMFPWNNQPF